MSFLDEIKTIFQEEIPLGFYVQCTETIKGPADGLCTVSVTYGKPNELRDIKFMELHQSSDTAKQRYHDIVEKSCYLSIENIIKEIKESKKERQ